MTTWLAIAYLTVAMVTFIRISGDDPYIEEPPVTAIANILAGLLWPIYWPMRFIAWLSGVAR